MNNQVYERYYCRYWWRRIYRFKLDWIFTKSNKYSKNIEWYIGESSKLHSTKNDPILLNIVNSASIACGYHAGDEKTMEKTIEISKRNNVSIGAHPSFKDRENFGRKNLENLWLIDDHFLTVWGHFLPFSWKPFIKLRSRWSFWGA